MFLLLCLSEYIIHPGKAPDKTTRAISRSGWLLPDGGPKLCWERVRQTGGYRLFFILLKVRTTQTAITTAATIKSISLWKYRLNNNKTKSMICKIGNNFLIYFSSSNSDLLSRVYHTLQWKNTPICQSLPFFLRTQRLPQNAPYRTKGRMPSPRWYPAFARSCLPFRVVLPRNLW